MQKKSHRYWLARNEALIYSTIIEFPTDANGLCLLLHSCSERSILVLIDHRSSQPVANCKGVVEKISSVNNISAILAKYKSLHLARSMMLAHPLAQLHLHVIHP